MNERETEVLNTIFSMATKNPEFRNKLLTEPTATLENFEISDRAKHIIIDAIRSMLNH
jgi:hypothetical protein